MKIEPLHRGLWLSLIAIGIWSFVGCRDLFTWTMEIFPVVIGSGILLAVYSKVRLTPLVCLLLWLHAIVLLVGGHYTYAEVPLFNWIRDHFHLARNDYDRLGHLMQGFVPALVSREILLRRGVLRRGGWLNFLVICICLAISAFYELLEWQTAVWTGSKADAFLGSQGDPWDTQWDMTCALIGATISVYVMSKFHDRQLARIQ